MQGDGLTVKLSDLGIAQELYGRTGAKPQIVQHRIMAPEVAAGGYSTKQSDLYQLGLLMFQMHTGEYPLDTSLGYDAIVQQIREGVPRHKAESLGTAIGDIVAGMLRRTEHYRYTSALQVWEDLRRLDSSGAGGLYRAAITARARSAGLRGQRPGARRAQPAGAGRETAARSVRALLRAPSSRPLDSGGG